MGQPCNSSSSSVCVCVCVCARARACACVRVRPPNKEQRDCLITTAILLDFGPNCLISIFLQKHPYFFRYRRKKKNRGDVITHHVHNSDNTLYMYTQTFLQYMESNYASCATKANTINIITSYMSRTIMYMYNTKNTVCKMTA